MAPDMGLWGICGLLTVSGRCWSAVWLWKKYLAASSGVWRMPTVHHKNPKAMEYASEFASLDVDSMYWAARRPRLFYLWGHSYEFDQDDNWDLLDNLCQKLARRDDTWYATNMEIYRYVTASQSLIFSADNKIVYNPSLLTVWFDVDGVLYQAGPGETRQVNNER